MTNNRKLKKKVYLQITSRVNLNYFCLGIHICIFPNKIFILLLAKDNRIHRQLPCITSSIRYNLKKAIIHDNKEFNVEDTKIHLFFVTKTNATRDDCSVIRVFRCNYGVVRITIHVDSRKEACWTWKQTWFLDITPYDWISPIPIRRQNEQSTAPTGHRW